MGALAWLGFRINVRKNKEDLYVKGSNSFTARSILYGHGASKQRRRRGKGDAFGEANDGEQVDCCRHWNHLGRRKTEFQRERLPVLHRRFDAGRFRHQQSERYWGRIQFDRSREVSGNLRGG